MAYINASKNAGLNKNRVTKRKKPTGYINASASKEKNRGGLLGGLGYVGGRLGLGIAGVAEGVGDILTAGSDFLRGDTEMAKYRFKNNETAELTEKLDETYNPGMIMRGAGDVASGLGGSLTFMIPYAGPYLAAAGYTGMGISSAAEKTGDVGLKELGYGAASGALEFGLEALTGGAGKAAKNIGASITRKLGKEAAQSTAKATAKLAGKSFGKSVLTETLKGMRGEAIEEAASEAIDPLLQKIFHIDPNAKTSLRDVAYAGMIGALSGGLMTVGPAAINYKTSASVGKDIRESGNTKDFLDYTRRVLDASTRTRERHAEKAEASKTSADAGKLKKTVDFLNLNSATRKSKRAGKRVEDMAETVGNNLKTYEGYLQKADKSPKELEISDAVLGELRGNVFLLENATAIELYEDTVLELEDDDKQELVDEINEDAKRLGLKRSDYTVTDLNDNVDDILTTVAIKYMMPEKYGVNIFEESKAKKKPAEPAQEAAEPDQGAETVQAEQQPAEAAKPAQGRYKGAGAVRIAGGKQVKELGLSDEQYRAYKAAEIMAPALGTEIEINESLERDGKTVNGYFDPKTNTLKININAVRGDKKIALYTLGHESTHYVKANAPEQFGRLADFVETQLGERWSTLTAEKRESLSNLNLLTGMTEEQIADLVREEVVADGMELILTDGKVLEELANQDKSLWETIKEWITETIAKIKEYYGQLNRASKTAQTLRETLNTLEEVERLFTEGVREAGERAGTEETESLTRMNEEKMSVSDKTYSIELADYEKPITMQDIEVLRSIGRKSINAFTFDDIEKAQKWAYKFYKEMGTKSPFFRAWFGDWRAFDTKTKLPVIAVNAETIERGDVPRGDFKNEDTGWNITSNSDGIDETSNKEQKRSDSYHALKDIDDLLKNAVLLDTVVVTDPSKRMGKNAALMHHMYCPISVKGEIGVAKLYVAESLGDTHKFYLMRIEKASTAMGFNTENGESTPHSQAATDDAMVSIAQIFEFVKEHHEDFEKHSDHYVPFEPKPVNELMLDENKEPRVFYHGTRSQFTEFILQDKPKFGRALGDGFYFTPSYSKAHQFANGLFSKGQDRGGIVMPVYLRMENPFVIEETADRTKWRNEYHKGDYDGIIDLKNQTWYVEGSTQIKSATDNIGTFDRNNPDIRYSIDDTDSATDTNDGRKDAKSTDVSESPLDAAVRRMNEREKTVQEHVTLADALMGAAQSEQEYRAVKNYKAKAEELAEAEERLADLRRKTAKLNKEIALLKERKTNIDKDRPEPEAAEAEEWIDNELNEAQSRKQGYMDEMDEIGEMLAREKKTLLSLSVARPLQSALQEEQKKAAAMERAAERAWERERETKAWARGTVKAAYEKADERVAETKEWAKETVRGIRAEANEKVRQAREDATDYKSAVYAKAYEKADARVAETKEWAKETVRGIRAEANEKVRQAREDATDYKSAVYAKAYEKADERVEKYEQKREEQKKQSEDRREITLRVRTVRKILGQLNTMLYHPNRQKHVPEGLQGLTEAVLKSADPQEFRKNRGNIRTMAELAASIDRLERKTARTAGEQETLDRMKSKYEHLEAETISTYKQAKALLTAFEQYQKDTLGKDGFDKETVENMAELVEQIKEVPMTEMTLESLKAVETFYTMILHQVNTANQTFSTEKALNIDELGQKASQEARDAKALKVLSPKGREWVGMASVRKFFLQNMKPLTVFEAIGSNQFRELFQRVLDGEETWANDILDARKKILDARERYKYKKWELDERKAVKTKDGTVELSLAERMAIYAYSFRDQAKSHLEGGGFVLDPNATEQVKVGRLTPEILEKRLNNQKRYTMDEFMMGELAETLSDEQKAYVKEMQQYLTDMGKKGNEVSKKLYGMEIFTEEHYFPIKVKSEYLASHTGKTGDPNIKNRGMTKEVVPEAKDPLVLQGFDEVMVDHINSMATYHSFVLPIEDLTRVLNYKPVNYLRDEDGNVVLDKNGKPKVDEDANKQYDTLKSVISSKYGDEVNRYIVQLIRDLNGGARRDAAAGIIDKGITQFKRASTMASLSVLIQQPTSIVRAAAYIDPKYLLNTEGLRFSPKKHKELWERVKKYAPVAIIKEMGGYDTGVGARTADYLNAAKYEKGERLKGFLTDSDYRAEVFGIGAAYADELAWVQMFEACVNEQADKLGKSRDSEEVLKAAGERFTEIVRHTQVYDSTLTRSENMRSKDTGAKMATAFMAEPTTVVSMIAEALIKGERGDKKFLRNTVGAVIGSILLNSLMSSLVYAMRDDDEDKTYGEKYVSTLAMEMAEGINPAEYFPVLRDIMSLVKGYEVERSDMALIGDLINSIRRMSSSQQTVAQKLTNTGGAVAAFFGLPVTNVMRDVNGLTYTFLHQTDTERYTGKGLSVAMMEEFDTMWNLFGEKTTNGYQLYQSALDHDAEHFARVAARYESEAAAEQALRKALREYDPRINEAAEARLIGELDVYEDIVSQIEAEGNFDRNMVIRAINNEMIYIKDHMEDETAPKAEEDEDEEETAEALYKTSDLNAALERGDDKDYGDIYDYLMELKQEDGKTEAQARSAVKSSITSYWKKRYLEAWEANDTGEIKRIQSILTGTKLYGSRNEVAKMGEGWVKAYAESLIKK